MLEAILLLAAGLGYVLHRLVHRPAGAGAAEEVGDTLLDILGDAIREMDKPATEGFEPEAETAVRITAHAKRLNLEVANVLYQSIRREEGEDRASIVEAVVSGLRVVADGGTRWVRDLLEQERSAALASAQAAAPPPPPPVEAPQSGLDPSLAGPRKKDEVVRTDVEALKDQSRARLTSRKMQERFNAVQDLNEDLRKQVKRLYGERADKQDELSVLLRNLEQSEQFIKDLERSNRELSLCIDTLENTNEDLYAKICQYEEAAAGADGAAESDPPAADADPGTPLAETMVLDPPPAAEAPPPEAAPEPAVGPEAVASGEDTGAPIDQSDLDALLQEAQATPDQEPAPDEGPGEPPREEAGPAGDVLSQDDLDALFGGGEPSPEAAAEGGAGQAAGPRQAPEDEESAEVLDQDALDALLAGSKEEQQAPTAPEPAESDEPTAPPDNLESVRKSLEQAESEYMEIFNTLSPLHEAVRTQEESEISPDVRKNIETLEGQLSAKEDQITDLSRRMNEMESAQA